MRTLRRMGAVGAVSIGLLGAAGCAPPKDEVKTIDRASSVVQAVNDKAVQQAAALNDPNSPLNGEWKLEPGSLTVAIPDGALPTLTIGNGGVNGFDGCTTYNAGAAILADQFLLETIGHGDSTACTPDASAVEQAYLAALGNVGSYRLDGARLVLLDLGGQAVLAYTR